MNDEIKQPALLNVASSPHWRDGSSIAQAQQLWLLALLPAAVASIWLFGWSSARIIGFTIAFSVAADSLANKILPSKDHTTNWTAVTFAVLLAFLMPYSTSWWLLLIGSVVMIVIGKKLFGGYGAYPVHPVLLAYAMLRVSWPQRFDFTRSMITLDWSQKMIEPLRLIRTMGADAESAFQLKDLLLGYQVAGIGNALVLYLAIGGVALILLRQITWHIPVGFLVGNFMMSGILHLAKPEQFASPVFYLLAGGTVFAAFFLATEYTTSPVNRVPMLLYGLLGGALLMLIQGLSNHIDGVAFTILLMNICSPLLDKITPRVRGVAEVSHA